MTILVWCSWVCPSGGMERVALSLASGLNDRGHRVLLVGPYNKVPILRNQVGRNVDCIDFDPYTYGLGVLRTAKFLRSVVRRYSVDVISAHGSLFPLLLLPGTPIVWTEHAIRYPHRKTLSGLRGVLWRLIANRLRARNWEVIGVSNFVLNSVRTQLHLDSSIGRTIYNALPQAEALSALPPPKLRPPYQLGYLGRLEDEKRPMDLFDLKKYVDALGLECDWHIFGSGSLSDSVKERATNEGGGRMHVQGYIADTSEAFRMMDLLVLPSRLEGLPTVVLEARLARRPVVGWRTAGIPEAAGEQGYLADPPFELSRLATRIVEALRGGVPSSPNWENFGFDEMMSNYEAAFNALIPKTQGGGVSRPESELAGDIRSASRATVEKVHR